MNTTLLYRLAWKEFRTLRALWLSLLGIAIVLQFGAVLIDNRDGDRVVGHFGIALWLPVVYLLAAAAIAFAGEREEGTDQLLCRLSVPPMVLLTVKAAMIVLSAVAILAVLYPLAWTFTIGLDDRLWAYRPPPRHTVALHGYRQVVSSMHDHALFWAIGFFPWGVFCSLLCRRVLTCLIVATVAATLTPTLIAESLNLLPSRLAYSESFDWTLRLGVVPALLLLSSVWLVGRWDEERWPRAIEWLGRFGGRLHRFRVRVIDLDSATDAKPTRVVIPKQTHELADVLQTEIRSWTGFVSIVPALLRRVGLCWPDAWLPAWRREARRLLWLEWRSAWRVSLGLIVAGTLGLLTLTHTASSQSDRRFTVTALPLTLAFVAFALGVWSFHGQQREQRFRFFAGHGASPAVMWLVKHVVWLSFALFAVVLLLFAVALMSEQAIGRDEFVAFGLQDDIQAVIQNTNQVHWQLERPDWRFRLLFCLMQTTETRQTELYRLEEVFDVWPLISLVFLAIGRGVLLTWLCFAVGQLASLLIPRAATALFVGLFVLLIVLGWCAMISFDRVPLLIAIWPVLLGLIAANWGRMSDWLEERTGWRRWLRVATTALLPMFAAFVGMAAYRVYEIPSVRLPWQVVPISAAARQTGEDWRRLAERLESPFNRPDARRNPVDPNGLLVTSEYLKFIKLAHWHGFAERDWLTNNAALLEEALQLTNRPDCSLPESWYWTELTQKQLGRVALLLKMSAFESLANHRLDEALQRALALYRFGQHLGRHRGGDERWARAIDVQVAAVQVLREWALSPDQTEASLLAALGRSDVAATHPLAQFVRAEGNFAVDLYEVLRSDYAYSATWLDQRWRAKPRLLGWAFWEQAREQRLLNVLAVEGQANFRAAMTPFVRLNPRHPSVRYERLFLTTEPFASQQRRSSHGEWWRTMTVTVWPGASWHPWMVANHFVPTFGTLETHRRGLWLTLALQAHRLKHGRLPDRLDELVGPYLDRLPSDPISGQSFAYFRNEFSRPFLSAPGYRGTRREYVTRDYLRQNRDSLNFEGAAGLRGVEWRLVFANPIFGQVGSEPYLDDGAMFLLTPSL